MKIFLIKTCIIFFLIFITFKLTIGSVVRNVEKKLDTYTSREQVILLKEKVREEILKGTTKDRILSKEDAKLMKNFLQKLQKEIGSE